MKLENDIKIEIVYKGSCQDDLNANLDGYAETMGGKFESFREFKSKNCSVRTYSFENDENLDEFFEISNLLISRHFPFEIQEMERITQTLKFNFENSIYHHLEFEELKFAVNFAISFRALYNTYSDESRYDIHIFKNPETKSFFVIYGFPEESIISVIVDSDEFEQDEELFSMGAGKDKNDKNKLN